MAQTLGRYELIAEIGRGGMADVKLAMQRGPSGFEKLVVVKLVQPELVSDAAIVEMFREEGKLSALIKHPNVVDVYELGEENGQPFIAMEYLEGEPLLAVLDKGTAGPRIDPLSIARIIADAAEGLEAAHTLKDREGKPLGLVHHDISLGNIFVCSSGQVKLLDFGVAKAHRAAAKRAPTGGRQDDKVFGKLAYMAPEKLDERPGDRRSDIWSLGCVLWEALAFKRLFKGANDVELIREVRYVNVPAPSTVNRDVPGELDPVVLRALQRDPSRRYQSARELSIALEEVLSAKGYPAKNFKIATYMMQAFSDVIAARERLLREVAGPVRPSHETIEAVFGDAPVKRESLPSFDHLLDPSNQIVLPEGSTGADVALAVPGAAPPLSAVVSLPVEGTLTEVDAPTGVPGAPPPKSATVSVVNPFDDSASTVFDDVPANAEASRALRYEADPSWVRGKHGQGLKELQRKAQEMRENPGGYGRRMLGYTVGGALAAVTILVVAVKTCGGDDTRKPAPVAKPADPPVAGDAGSGPPVTPDAAVAVAIAADAETSDEIEMPPEALVDRPADKKPDDKKPERPKPTKSAEALYAEGLAAWKKQDTRTAYERFTEGRRANGKYANNWYGLGLVHEKAGRKKDARTAYERYLQLAPNAPQAAKLRDHIKKNLM